MDTLPEKVRKFRPARSGKCPPLAFILIAVLSPLGFWLGMYLAGWVIDLIHFDFILLTLFIVWFSTAAGTILGNTFGGYCRNLFLLGLALAPTQLFTLFVGLEMILTIEFGSSGLSDSLGAAEAVFIAGTPIAVLFFMRGDYFCEACRESYETGKQLWMTVENEPGNLLNALKTQNWLPDSASDEHAKSADAFVSVSADYCPKCFEAALHATYTTRQGKKNEKKERLVYSEHWPGARFKALHERLAEFTQSASPKE